VKAPADETPAPRKVQAPPDEAAAGARTPPDEAAPGAKRRTPPGETEPPVRSVKPRQEESFEGVLWKGRDRDGHDLYVTEDLRFFRCTECEELELTYKHVLDLVENKPHRERLESIREDFNRAKALAASNAPDAAAQAQAAKKQANERLEDLANTLAGIKQKQDAAAKPQAQAAQPTPPPAAAQSGAVPKLTPPADPNAFVGSMNGEAVRYLKAARDQGASPAQLVDLYNGMKLQIEAEASVRGQEWGAGKVPCEGGYTAFIGNAKPALVIPPEPGDPIYIGEHTRGPGSLVDSTPKVSRELGFHFARPNLDAAQKKL
jgi:hypothetical protein